MRCLANAAASVPAEMHRLHDTFYDHCCVQVERVWCFAPLAYKEQLLLVYAHALVYL